MVDVITAIGLNLEVHHAIGIAIIACPKKAEEPRTPCMLGDKFKSSVIDGNIKPKVKIIMKPNMVAISHTPITTQPYLSISLFIECQFFLEFV
jgi:hypothetical protein